LRHWEELSALSDLTEDELKQIPSDNVISFHSAISFYKKNGWDVNLLLKNTDLTVNDFEEISKWINPIEGETIVKNFFANAPCFLSHKMTFFWGFDRDKKIKFRNIFRYTPFKDIMANAERTSRKVENSYNFEIVQTGSFSYGMKIIPKKFKYSRLVGYEFYIAKGYLKKIHSIKKVKMIDDKNICFSADLKKIINFFYFDHGFVYEGDFILHNSKIFSKMVKAKDLPSLDGLHPWSDDDLVYIILEDYIFNDEVIFSKGEVYNTPFCYLTWSVKPISALLERIKNIFYFYIKKSIPELELQFDQNNLKAKEMLQISALLKQEKQKKELLMANIVHEIKSPLASIVMLLDSIKGNVVKESDFVKESFSHLSDKSSKLINFVDNVMSYFSLDTNNFNLNLEVIDIAFLMNDVLDNFSHLSLKSGKVYIYSNITPDKYIVRGDYYRLLQLFLNIINNSVKFTSEGIIKIESYIEDKSVVVCVKDTGIGIKKEQLELIFNKFKLVQDNPCSNYNGLGLGLYIAQNIVNSHNGKILVESVYGEGSEFKVVLPLYVYE